MDASEVKIARVCFSCGKEIESDGPGGLSKEGGIHDPPSDATHWTTHGNFGTVHFDPIFRAEFLEIHICDECLEFNADRVIKYAQDENEKVIHIKQMESIEEINKLTWDDCAWLSGKTHEWITAEKNKIEQAEIRQRIKGANDGQDG